MTYPLTPEMYVDQEGAKCPACGSTSWEPGACRARSHFSYQARRCDTCGATWDAVFTLLGYGTLSIALPAEQEIAMLIKMVDQMLRLTLGAEAFLTCREGMAEALLRVPSVRARLQELWTQTRVEDAKAERKTDWMGRVEGRILVGKDTDDV